ncbi:MAG TPA: LamG domain-containing protein [Candidatus Saccharimonadales bacterium]|nr:LamG domain-containing protein [Candidatus Saccharimonadales bacterium]
MGDSPLPDNGDKLTSSTEVKEAQTVGSEPIVLTPKQVENTPVDEAPLTDFAAHTGEATIPKPLLNSLLVRMVGFGLLAAAIVFLVAFFLIRATNHYVVERSNLNAVSIPLKNLPNTATTSSPSDQSVSVNGTLRVTNTVVVEPSKQPSSPTAGQLYFNQTNNMLEYYNGSSFQTIQGSGTPAAPGATTNVNNIFNSTVGSTGNLSASGATTGSLAVFNGSTLVGNSLITQNGQSTVIGGNVVQVGTGGASDVTVGSVNATSATTIQAGTGGMALLTGAATSASGTISIISGDSSTTSAGNVSLDTGASAITGVTLGSWDFETASQVNDWSNNYIGFFTLTQDCTVAHTGSCSMNQTGFGTGGGSDVFMQQEANHFTLTPFHQYVFSAWVKAATTAAPITAFTFGITNCDAAAQNDSSTQWTHVTWSCVDPAGVTTGWLILGFGSATTETHYWDDISATDVSASSTAAIVSLGATNAQEVTIGNINQIDPTSIYGAGISINSGLQSITEKGTALFKPNVDGTSAFQVENASGGTQFNIDTTNNIVSSGDTMVINTPSGCNYANYGTYLMTFSPSAYWKLEDSGGTAADSSGNNDTGTLSNVTTGITPGPFSCATGHTAMSFNAPNTSTITTATSFTSPTTYTQIALFKTSNQGLLIGDRDNVDSNYDRELYVGNDGKLHTRIFSSINGNDDINSPSTVNDGNWHMAVATESNAGLYLYLDGNLVAHNTADTSPQGYTGSWWMGHDNNFTNFTGDLGEVAVVPTALTAGQVANLATDAGLYSGNLSSLGIGTNTPGANLDDEGSALFKDSANSTTALQIENSTGVPLLAADTTNMAFNVYGSAIFEDSTASTTAFQIENGSGVPLFTADTSGANITVSGPSSTNFATFYLTNTHLESTQTTPPNISNPLNCGTGTGDTAALTAGSTDTAGSFTITTGSTGSPTTCDTTITFHFGSANAPKSIIVVGTGNAASAARQIYVSGSMAATFTTSFGVSSGVTNSTTYTFDYLVVE